MEVAHGCRVHEGHEAHTQDTYLRAVTSGDNQFLEAVRNTEEERPIDLIDLYPIGQGEHLLRPMMPIIAVGM